MNTHAQSDQNPLAAFLLAGPAPDRACWKGWEHWRETRGSFTPAPRMTAREYHNTTARRRGLYDLHRTATHVNLKLLETPMSRSVSGLMRQRLVNNALKFSPGTLDGLMINGGGFQGKTETACEAAAVFEETWLAIHQELLPEPAPGTRDLFAPVAYCRLPVRATPKALCKAILDFYGSPHPPTLDDLVRAVRESVRDHRTTTLLIDNITRLRLHREDDEDTFDLIRELMDVNVTLVLIGVDIPHSGLLRGAYYDAHARQWIFPETRTGKSRNPLAATQTERRFDLVDLDPFDYTGSGINAFLEHLAGIEDQLRLLRAFDGMLTTGAMPEYLFRRSRGIVGLLRRLIEDGCAKAMATGAECLTPQLLADTPIRLEARDDLDPQTGEVPQIPQNITPPRTRTRARNTVFDDRGAARAAGE